MAKAILIHGNGGSTSGDIWLPYLERELSDLGIETINRTFPDNEKASMRIWLPFITELGAGEDTILIGHSSGAEAAMRYAEGHQLLGSVLVGACYTDLGDSGEKASGYYTAAWQWDKIRQNQQWIAVFGSTDDPYIPVTEQRLVAKSLHANYFEYTDRGHFMGSREFPEIVAFVKKKLGL